VRELEERKKAEEAQKQKEAEKASPKPQKK